MEPHIRARFAFLAVLALAALIVLGGLFALGTQPKTTPPQTVAMATTQFPETYFFLKPGSARISFSTNEKHIIEEANIVSDGNIVVKNLELNQTSPTETNITLQSVNNSSWLELTVNFPERQQNKQWKEYFPLN